MKSRLLKCHFRKQRAFLNVERVPQCVWLIFDWNILRILAKVTVKRNWCRMDAYHALIATLDIGWKGLEFHDPKMSAGWKQDPLNCHSLPPPNAHLCHYQNKEASASCQRQPLMLLVMTMDFFFPHRGVCLRLCDKEMSPFILEENALYKLPLTFLSVRQQSRGASGRILEEAGPRLCCLLG